MAFMLCSLATIEFFNSKCNLYAILSLITDSFLLVNERYANSFSPNNSLLSCKAFSAQVWCQCGVKLAKPG